MKKTTTNKTSLDWQLQRNRLNRAADEAEAILQVEPDKSLPIDPFAIVANEGKRVKLFEDDYLNSFDGQLEYRKKANRFIIFLNNKYDHQLDTGKHHARTRFSLSHELGHLFLPHHVSYLISGGKPHGSKGEFQHDEVMELEADAFASALLMPRRLFGPQLNETEPSLDHVRELALAFDTSLTATLFRSVNLSDFPCALVSVKEGKIRWSFSSKPLIDVGCYPPERGPLLARKAIEAWKAYQSGETDFKPGSGLVRSWFRTYDRDNLLGVSVCEEYLALPWRDDLLIFLTLSEEELLKADDAGDDD